MSESAVGGEPRKPTWFQKVRCLVVFHKLRTVQEFGPAQRKVHCSRCDQYFAMHDGMQAFLPWDEDLEYLYANVGGYGRTIR